MKKNMGVLDRRLRLFLVAPALLLVGLLVGPLGWLAVVLYVLAGVMAATSVAGSCPLYALVGLSSCPVDPKPVSTTPAGRAG
jgi:hypothetical protein